MLSDNGSTCEDTNVEIADSEFELLNFMNNFEYVCEEDNSVQETDPNPQTISVEQYRNLLKHMTEVNKLKNIIQKMSQTIKSKDATILELRKTIHHLQKKEIQLSSLSAVI